MATVLVLLAQGCEEVEAVTVIDLMRRAGFEVVSAGLSETREPVTCSRGVVLLPDTVLTEVSGRSFDLVVLPGGQPGTDNLRSDPRVKELLEKQAAAGRHVAAICAAPMVLAEAGLLQGLRATSYPGCLTEANAPDTRLEEAGVVCDGHIVTSRGPGTAMDFALRLIELLAGKELRTKVEAGLVRTI